MKKRLIFSLTIPIIVAVVVCALLFAINKKPFDDLKATDVVSASVLLLPPNQIVEIDDTERLTALLKDIELVSRAIRYRFAGGQSCRFTLIKADGSIQEIQVFGSYVIIDGKGYIGKYSPNEELNAYANSLVDT